PEKTFRPRGVIEYRASKVFRRLPGIAALQCHGAEAVVRPVVAARKARGGFIAHGRQVQRLRRVTRELITQAIEQVPIAVVRLRAQLGGEQCACLVEFALAQRGGYRIPDLVLSGGVRRSRIGWLARARSQETESGESQCRRCRCFHSW